MSNRTPFNESFVSKHVHPAYYQHDNADAEKECYAEKMAEALGQIFDWLLETPLKPTDKRYLKSIALRTVSIAWVVDPARFKNDSLRSLAKQLGVKVDMLSRSSSDVSKKFKIKNQFKSHDWKNN